MALYLMLTTLTEKGVQTLNSNPARLREVISLYRLDLFCAGREIHRSIAQYLIGADGREGATYKIAKEAREALEKHYPEFLLKQVIRQCTKFAQASSEGTPIFAYDAESKGAEDIQAVLDEVRAKIGDAPKLKLATAPVTGAKEQA